MEEDRERDRGRERAIERDRYTGGLFVEKEETELGREPIDFFCPQATKLWREVVRGTETGDVKAHRQPPRYTMYVT